MAAALAAINQGPSIDWDSGTELLSRYKKWKQKVEVIFEGPLKAEDEEVKCKYLLIWAGDRGLDLFNSWGLSAADQKVLKNYWSKFEEYVNPQANFLVARHKLHRLQQGDRSFEQFLIEARLSLADCGYAADVQKEILRDTLVFGLKEDRVRTKCISQGNGLTLDKTIEIARTFEATTLKTKEIVDKDAVHAVHKKRKPPFKRQSTDYRQDRRTFRSDRQDRDRDHSKTKSCFFCGGGFHKRDKCPAKNATCRSCSKVGHYDKVCQSKGKSQRLHEIEEEFSDLFVGSIEVSKVDSVNAPEIIRKFAVTTQPYHKRYSQIMCKLDTGAATNVISKSQVDRLFPENYELTPPKAKLIAYGGTEIANYGSCTLYIRHDGKKHPINFDVTDSGATILGLKTCQFLDLIRINCEVNKPSEITEPLTKQKVLEEHGDVFSGIGCFPGDPYHIQLRSDAEPVINPPRSVPVHLQDQFQAELKRMVKLGIISKVTEPTEWVNSFVVVDKGAGKGLRICLDPREINKSIKREHTYTRTVDDIAPLIAGATHFSVVDARSGYWMVPLDKASSLLTTFSTPFGRFCYNRLPFGLIVSQDIFQQKMDQLCEGLSGITGIADDLIVYGIGEKAHDGNFLNLLQTARDNNVRFNQDKLQFKIRDAHFFGHMWSADGMKPDPAKVRAITEMAPPDNIKDLQSFLGLVNYLNRFNASIATVAAPLRDLTKKDISWQWNPEHQTAFDKLKDIIVSAATLAYYDPKKDTVIQSDASLRGLGACLLQDGRPVVYASRTLSTTEQNYSNIERELLGVVWSLERFNHYVYGKHVEVQTDHKPIVAAHKKPISKCSPRLQRLLLRMSKYDVEVVYLPGKDNVLADALSRVDPNKLSSATDHKEIPEIPVHYITETVNSSNHDIEKIRTATAADPTLQILKKHVIEGWPAAKNDCPPEVMDYWNYREDMSIEDGIIFKCNRFVVPDALRPQMLNLIHQGHMGMEKCLLRAKMSVFWPRITHQVKQTVETCATCQKYQNRQGHEPLIPHEIAQYPWQKIATDLFEHSQVHYLLFVDYYSKFPVVRRLGKSLSSEVTVAYAKSVISEYGIPEEIVSDNGPQYASATFRSFCANYQIKHTTSSPLYPQSNGMIERCVQTVKKLIKKALDAGEDANLALLNYRATPVSHNLPSPVMLLMNRNTRTLLPMKKSSLKSQQIDNDITKAELVNRQNHQKSYYDKTARSAPLPPLEEGQSVRVRDNQSKHWQPAKVTRKLSEPRSYIVETDQGGQYRRNRSQLHTTKEQFSNNTDLDISHETDTQVPQPAVSMQPDNNQYTTRSGRAIHPPDRLNL